MKAFQKTWIAYFNIEIFIKTLKELQLKTKRKITLIIIVTIIITVIATGLALEYSIQNGRYDDGVIQTKILSEQMNEERDVIIHLPENYKENSQKRYPVLYILDGTSQDAHTAEKVGILSKVAVFPEAIIVGIPNTSGNRSRDFTPHYMKIDLNDDDSKYGNGDKFLNYIEKELIPFINKNYRTDGFQTISGNSRGGLFALYALLEKPQLFNGYICYSPAFWREDVLISKKAKSFFKQNKLEKKFIYMSIGDAENDKMKNGFRVLHTLLLNEFSKDKEMHQVDFHSEVTQNGNHGNNSYKSTVFTLKYLGKYMGFDVE